ncbi:hypothetical protein [Dactylosporangium sp. NPDC000521]|uniref:hypothetical protein n=1 Tax=Dactylosporangium sp. NPDC000521 TaxID=3363975 RepID=UPI00369DC0BE
MRRAGLRTRVVGGFAVGALLLSASMAFATYQATRHSLLEGRERASVRAVSFDTRILREGVLTDQVDAADLLRSLDTGGNRRAMLYHDGGWLGRAADDGTIEAVVGHRGDRPTIASSGCASHPTHGQEEPSLARPCGGHSAVG